METIYQGVLVHNFIFIDKVAARSPHRNLSPCKSLWTIVLYRADVTTVMQQNQF